MFIKDLYRDEIRDGWLVKSDIKKVWNRQLEICQEVDRICRKHNIPYWADGGTLIGAARHKGFIPWDEDIDLCMMRPDYNRFCDVLADELNAPFEIKEKLFGLIRISHSQTTLIDAKYLKDKPQGLSIDVCALDIVDDGTSSGFVAFNAFREVFMILHDHLRLESHLYDERALFNDIDFLKEISEIANVENRIKFFDLYAVNLFKQSSMVAFIDDIINGIDNPFRKEWFDETIYLPFEMIEMPAPKKFDEILTAYYGDWRTPVNDSKHRLGYAHSADIPWREFLKHFDIKICAKPSTTGNDVYVTFTARKSLDKNF